MNPDKKSHVAANILYGVAIFEGLSPIAFRPFGEALGRDVPLGGFFYNYGTYSQEHPGAVLFLSVLFGALGFLFSRDGKGPGDNTPSRRPPRGRGGNPNWVR